MADRIQFYAGSPVDRLLAAAGGWGKRSLRLNNAVDRYLTIVEELIPALDFTEAEWRAMAAAVASEAPIPATVADAGHAELAERLRELPTPARMALIEAIERRLPQDER